VKFNGYTFRDGDAVLKVSLLFLGRFLGGADVNVDVTYLCATRDMCRLRTMHPIKHPTYRWSNSGSENKAENTLFKRPTYWIYHKILKYIGVDPYKGCSFDQLRAWWIITYIFNDKKAAFKNLLGIALRLGFAPSLMENIIFKPQCCIMALATIWEPLRYLVYPFYAFSRSRNLKIGTWDNTTNKISLLPTMLYLGHHFNYPKDFFFIKRVYTTYFCQDDNKHVGEAMINGFKYALSSTEGKDASHN